MSLRQGNKVIAGHINYHPDLFDHKWADHILNDVQWLRADTFSWQDGSIYAAAYNHLVEDVEGKEYISETIGGHTVWYRLADDGHKIVTQASDYDGSSAVNYIYEATGVAWYYIIDTTNQRFKLPRISPVKEMLASSTSAPVVTNGVQPIFTDGSQNGSLRQAMKNLSGYTCYMYADGVSVGEWSSTALKFGSQTGLKVDLSQTTSTSYFKGNKYLYFYVGNFTQTALENTAGVTTEVLNDKADLDFSNTTMIDYVVEKQDPNAGNNYTWYRKYKSGWVEQGGFVSNLAWNGYGAQAAITLPKVMKDSNYTVCATMSNNSASWNYPGCRGWADSVTQIIVGVATLGNDQGTVYKVYWQVSGKAAN